MSCSFVEYSGDCCWFPHQEMRESLHAIRQIVNEHCQRNIERPVYLELKEWIQSYKLIGEGQRLRMGLPYYDMYNLRRRFSFLRSIYTAEDEAADADECAICLQRRVENEKVVVLPCRHRFHESCGLRALKEYNTCPECRHDCSI